jgi:hypothetical protein
MPSNYKQIQFGAQEVGPEMNLNPGFEAFMMKFQVKVFCVVTPQFKTSLPLKIQNLHQEPLLGGYNSQDPSKVSYHNTNGVTTQKIPHKQTYHECSSKYF